jgi:hypothetical protein
LCEGVRVLRRFYEGELEGKGSGWGGGSWGKDSGSGLLEIEMGEREENIGREV